MKIILGRSVVLEQKLIVRKDIYLQNSLWQGLPCEKDVRERKCQAR